MGLQHRGVATRILLLPGRCCHMTHMTHICGSRSKCRFPPGTMAPIASDCGSMGSLSANRPGMVLIDRVVCTDFFTQRGTLRTSVGSSRTSGRRTRLRRSMRSGSRLGRASPLRGAANLWLSSLNCHRCCCFRSRGHPLLYPMETSASLAKLNGSACSG